MNISPARENIFKKIRQALSQSTPLPFPASEATSGFFQPSQQELEIEFAEQFSKLQGKFVFCLNEQELASQLTNVAANLKWKNIYCVDTELRSKLKANLFDNFDYADLATCDVSITDCELLVARTGSLVVSAASQSGRTTSVYAPIHVCIAYTDQLVYDIKDALVKLKEKYKGNLPSLISFASGPSRTADIEKTLVTGVHGPKEVYCFLVQSE
ncbi:MAG: LUD domain-containing protein [Chitinophagaceae bacterium]|nr:LUD domain-containing protein [Chitinophagaceae bacterium]